MLHSKSSRRTSSLQHSIDRNRRRGASDPAVRAAAALARFEMLERRQLLAGGPDRLVNNNIGANNTANFTQSETTLVAFGNTVVVGFNDSGSNAGGANRFTGFARSTDGGVTFTDGGNLPATAAGDAGDPVMARNEVTGRIYFTTLGFSSSQIQVWRSDTSGASWMSPVVGTPGGSSEDKEWITVDNFAGAGQGNVYLMSRRFGGSTGMYFYRSTNNGDSFSTGLLLAPGSSSPQGAFVTVGPDHSIYAFWYQQQTIQMRKSTDFGVTFAPAVTIASGLGGGTNGDLALTGMRQGTATFNNFRSNGFPHAAVNPISGNLYVTYTNNPAGTDKADVQLVQSTNGGASWSTPVRVNDDATTTDQWMPTIAVTPDGGNLGVFYYSRQEDPANNMFRFYGRIATLSGATTTFGASSAISDVASMPEFGRDSVVNSVYMGDYNHAVATPGAFHVAWADNRDNHPFAGGAPRKDPSVYYDVISLAPTVASSNFLFSTAPHRVQFSFSQNVSASLGTNDIVLENLTTSTIIPSGQLSLSYDLPSNTATFTYTGPGTEINSVLPDGNYRATLLASGITDPSGNPLPADYVFNFFFLNGDANRDARVNLLDFDILAANFGQSPRIFTQGDFSYDNVVNLLDFDILASRFGMSLAPQTSARGSELTLFSQKRIDELRNLLEEVVA